MKTRAVLLFAVVLLSLASVAVAVADTASGAGAPASGTLPAPADAQAPMSLAAPAVCAAAAPSLPALDPGRGSVVPMVLTCGTCSDSVCVGAAANAICGYGRKCFIITNCLANPKTWECTCSNIDP